MWELNGWLPSAEEVVSEHGFECAKGGRWRIRTFLNHLVKNDMAVGRVKRPEKREKKRIKESESEADACG